MPKEIGEIPQKVTRIIIDPTNLSDKAIKDQNLHPASETHDEYQIDTLFYRIRNFCYFLGVNFYSSRSPLARYFSVIFATFTCCINLYFVGYIVYLTLSRPFEAERIAFSISIATWVLQATLSTIFLAFWQYTGQPLRILKLLYKANRGMGIHRHRKNLLWIANSFFFVTGFCFCYYMVLIICRSVDVKVGYSDEDIHKIFGDSRLLIIVQLSSLYSKLCWAVAINTYCLLIHSTNYEFVFYNDQIRTMSDNPQIHTDESLCNFILNMMKIHNRLTECVKFLDQMFNRYTFVMMTTIIPTTIFSIFIVFRKPKESITLDMLFLWPLMILCILTFFALVNAPSKLHDTIYSSKSSLCANTQIWFPYRSDVYHSALAFVCHLDQANLGVSIWGFAVLSKPLVLTTLSAMVTCLALFLQVGECNTSYRHP